MPPCCRSITPSASIRPPILNRRPAYNSSLTTLCSPRSPKYRMGPNGNTIPKPEGPASCPNKKPPRLCYLSRRVFFSMKKPTLPSPNCTRGVLVPSLCPPKTEKPLMSHLEGLVACKEVWWICRNRFLIYNFAPPHLLGKFLWALLMHRQ